MFCFLIESNSSSKEKNLLRLRTLYRFRDYLQECVVLSAGSGPGLSGFKSSRATWARSLLAFLSLGPAGARPPLLPAAGESGILGQPTASGPSQMQAQSLPPCHPVYFLLTCNSLEGIFLC